MNFVKGEIVETFHNFSWKMATISKVLGGNNFLVRLLGSMKEIKVEKFNLRVRRSWQNDESILIGMDSQNFGKQNECSSLMYNKKSRFRVQERFTSTKQCRENDYCADEDGIKFKGSHIISSNTLKRGSPYYNTQSEAYEGAPNKFRAFEKGGRVVALSSFPVADKVDAVNFQKAMQAEEYKSSTRHRFIKTSELDMMREQEYFDSDFIPEISLEHNGSDRVVSSVGSCSIDTIATFDDIEGSINEAESFIGSSKGDRNCILPTKEELDKKIHKLELHAYHCTMQALYASGPLSWEKETLVTNLRLLLHISNDEHIMEIRNFISHIR